MKQHKILYYLSMATIFAALILVSAFTFQMLYPFRVITLKKPITVTPQLACPGEDVSLHMVFEKHLNISPDVSYFLLNDETYLLKDGGVTRPTGEQDIRVVKEIPSDAHAGEYVVQVKLEYPINMIRSIVIVWQSEPFFIGDSEVCGGE